MKESKKDKKPRPNMKNKEFVAWTRAETCRRDDNIVSTDWHERLKKLNPFVPVYDNKPLNMVYLLSGEYGRIWQKERDEWYKNVFVPQADQKDFEDRKKKIRKQAKAAKKAAEENAKIRKVQRAKELELKAKEKAEEAERLKERVRKLAAPKLPSKTPKKKKEVKTPVSAATPATPGTTAGAAPAATSASAAPAANTATEEKNCACPKGYMPVEATLCECSSHREEEQPDTQRTEASNKSCTMCEGYVQQMQNIHQARCKENEINLENSEEQGKEVEAN